MKILLWHVHGGWMDAFVRGEHEYLLPVNAGRDAWGLGRGGRDWPSNVREVTAADLLETEIDMVLMQRLEEIAAAESLTGRMPGRDLPAIYLEHNTPKADPVGSVHPVAQRDDILLAHVTHFNRLVWDNGSAPTVVIEHGIRDPGRQYSGELDAIGVVINEPVRRWRVTGTDLLPAFAEVAPLHVFGMATDRLPGAVHARHDRVLIEGDLPTELLHSELARRRMYLHPMRWTSLGLSLLEAMYLGMPVLALATTEATRAVPQDAGAVSAEPDALRAAARILLNDPDEARRRGDVARAYVDAHYNLASFLDNWNAVMCDQISAWRRRQRHRVAGRVLSGASSSGASSSGVSSTSTAFSSASSHPTEGTLR